MAVHVSGKKYHRNSETTGSFTVQVDDGRWTITITEPKSTSAPESGTGGTLGLFLRAWPIPGEPLTVDGTRLGSWAASFKVKTHGGTELSTLRLKPLEYAPRRSDLHKDMRGSRNVMFVKRILDDKDLEKMDSIIIEYTLTEQREDQAVPQMTFHTQHTQIIHNMAKLFDDPLTSDVCFIIRHTAPSSQEPSLLFAHSNIISSMGHFKDMFKSGFSDSETASADVHFAPHEWQEGEDSDYDGSDDGDDDDDDAQMSHSTSAAGDEENGSESAGKKVPSTGKASLTIPASKVKGKKVVEITDYSFRTFEAFIYYIYTASVNFAPLKSRWRSALEDDKDHDFGPDTSRDQDRSFAKYKCLNAREFPSAPGLQVPITSAKSMYRLADRYNAPTLKQAALQHITNSLTPENVVAEINSLFSHKYEDVRKVEREYLIKNWAAVSATKGFASLFGDLFSGYHVGLSGEWIEVLRKLAPIPTVPRAVK